MCSGDASISNSCCALIYNAYCQLFQLYQDCPPNPAITLPGVSYSTLLGAMTVTLTPYFNTAKCGKTQCCDGVVETVICIYRVALGALNVAPNDAAAIPILSGLSDILGAIFIFNN